MDQLLQNAQAVGGQAVNSVENLMGSAANAVMGAFQPQQIQSPVPQAQTMPQAQQAQPSPIQNLLQSLPQETVSALNMIGQQAQKVANPVENWLSQGVQNAGKAIGQQAQNAQKVAGNAISTGGQNVSNYFNPTNVGTPDNPTPNFWNTPVAQGLGEVQQFNQNAPLANFSQTLTQGMQNPVQKFLAQTALGIPESIINAYPNALRAGSQIGNDIQSGQISQPGNIIRDTAAAASPLLTLATLGGGTVATDIAENVGKQAGYEALGQAIKEGALTGAKWGGAFGGLQGLASSNQLGTQFVNAIQQGALGAGMGTLLGGVTGGLANRIGAIRDAVAGTVKSVRPDFTDQQAYQEGDKYIRNKIGQFAGVIPVERAGGGVMSTGEPVINDWHDLVDQKLGINPQELQSGFIKPSAFIPGADEEGTNPEQPTGEEENVKVVSTPRLYPNIEHNPDISPELAGKPNGTINHEVFVNGIKRGDIYQPADNRFQVMSDSVLGKFKARYFKTFDGAKNFLVNSRERYIPLDQVDLMTGQRKLPSQLTQQPTGGGLNDPKNLEYYDSTYDAHGDQTFNRLSAVNSNGDRIGYIEYTADKKEAHIQNIAVDPQYRRQGIATELYSQLQKNNQGLKINRGMMTDDGVKLFKSIDSSQPLPAQIQDLQTRVSQKQAENEAQAQLAQQTRSQYSNSQLQDIAQLKRLYANRNDFQAGDVETIRASQHAPLLNRVLETVRENTPITDDSEALHTALSVPTKADTTVSRVPEMQQLRETQARFKFEQQEFEKEFGRHATPAEQQQMQKESTQAMFERLGATKELPDDLLKQRAEIEASNPNPGDSVYNLEPTATKQPLPKTVDEILKGGKYATNKETITDDRGVQLAQLAKRTNPLLKPTKNTVDLPIKGDTEAERVKSAIANSEYIKNTLLTKGKDAYRAGLKLTPEDIKLSEQYQHGTPIDEMAKQSSNPEAFKDYMNKYVDYYDYRLTADRASGGMTPTRANYLPQTWDLSKPEDLARYNALAAQKGIRPWDGFRNQPRVFNTYAEGEAAGFTRLRPNTLQDLKADYQGASGNISKQVLKQGLQQAAPEHISTTGSGIDENGKPFVNSNIAGIEGISYTKNIHNLLKGYEKSGITQTAETFREKGFLQGAKEEGVLPTVGWLYDHASSVMKKTLLNLSFFHDVNVGFGNVGGSAFGRTMRGLVTLNPEEIGKGIRLGANVIKSIPSLFSEDSVRNVDEQFQDKMVKGQKYSVYDAIQKSGSSLDRGLPAETKMEKYNPLASTARATFDRYLHVLKLHLGDAIFGDGKIDPTSPQGQLAGQELDKVMGQINNITMNRNEGGVLGTKTLSRGFLAPQFTFSKFLTLFDAVSKGGEQGTIARDAVIGKSLLFGTLSTLGTLLATGKFPTLQKILLNFTFNPSIQTNMTNPKGRKVSFGLPATYTSELGRPLYTTITNPNHLAGVEEYGQARLNPMLSMLQQGATNKDYYGNPIIDTNSKTPLLQQVGQGVIQGKLPIGLQQIALQAEGKQNTTESVANILGLRAHVSSNDPTIKYFNNLNSVQSKLTPNQLTILNSYRVSSANGGLSEAQKANMLLANNGKNWSWMYPALKQIDQSEQVHNPILQLPEAQAKAYYTFLTMNPQQQAEYAEQNPDILNQKKSMQGYGSQLAVSQGKQPYPPNPLYSFPNKTIADYMTYSVLNKTAPGSAEEKQFYKNHPNILPVLQAVSQGYSNKSTGFAMSPAISMLMQPTMVYPNASPYVQQQLNNANYNDPQVQSYLANHLQYVNQERGVRGLSPIDSYGNIAGSKNYQGPATLASATGGMMGGATYPTKLGMPSQSQQYGFNRNMRHEFNYELKQSTTKLSNKINSLGGSGYTKYPKMPQVTRPSGNSRLIARVLHAGKSYKSHKVSSLLSYKSHTPRFTKLPLPKKERAKAVFI